MSYVLHYSQPEQLVLIGSRSWHSDGHSRWQTTTSWTDTNCYRERHW